jgi:hypothetical protein
MNTSPELPPLMELLETRIQEGTQRTKNRVREHAGHGWTQIGRCRSIILMECPCGWLGWLPRGSVN